MFTMYTNACVREVQEKYDMATLLLYRLLEMIEQRRLAVYGLYVSRMDYKNIRYNFEQRPDLEGQSPEDCFSQLKTISMTSRRRCMEESGTVICRNRSLFWKAL